MLTLVTASDTKFFLFLIRLIDNVINISNKKKIEIRIIVYNLGMTNAEMEKLNVYKRVTLEHFNFNKYPDYVSLEKFNGNNCSYAWKPIIIYDVCEKYGGLVHWMDTRNLYSNFNTLIKILKNDYIYTPLSDGNVEKWTHQKCIDYLNGLKYKNNKMRNAAIVGINYDIKWIKEFVKEWRDLALIKECICPEGSDRKNHRQDQSLLTLLYYKYNDIHKFKIINNYIDSSIHRPLKK